MKNEITQSIQHLSEGNTKLAEKILNRYLDNYPDDPDALQLLGICLHNRGKHHDAVRLIKEAIKRSPSVPGYHTNLGNVFKEAGMLDSAIASYKTAIDLNSRDENIYNNLGITLGEIGKMDEAVSILNQALKINPEFAAAHNSLGTVYSATGDLEQALESYQHAREIIKESPEILSNIGKVLIKKKLFREAISYLKQAVILNSRYSDAYNCLGSAYRSIGALDEAMGAFERAIEVGPENVVALCNYGSALHASKQIEKAVGIFKKVLLLDPDNPLAVHLLSACTSVTTKQPPPGYVRELFDEYAETFDHNLVESLGYKTPVLLHNMLESLISGRKKFTCVVDLGCGTGLSGAEFRKNAELLIGVDLSEKMIQQAEKKDIYDHLYAEGIQEFLNSEKDKKFDLFIVADTFVYIGELTEVFSAISSRAKPGALLLFSIETLGKNDPGYLLRSTGRYAHGEEYIASLAEEVNFSVIESRHVNLRKDYKKWIEGGLYLMKINK